MKFPDTEPRLFHYILLVQTVYSERMWGECAFKVNGKIQIVANLLSNTNLHKISQFELKIIQLEQGICAYLGGIS